MRAHMAIALAILSGHVAANDLLLDDTVHALNHSHGGHDHDHDRDHDDPGHNHTNCGFNAAVKSWMQNSLKLFDAGKGASQAMAKTQVQIASAGPSLEAEAPIRIHTEFQLSSMADYSKRYFLKYQLVPRMVAEIKRRILVRHPSTENLKVPRYCSMYYVRDDGGYNCAEVADQEYCSSPEVGIKHNLDFLDGSTVCTGTSESSCTAEPGGPGAKDTDFVLYVAANDVSFCTEGHIVAFAGTCALDLDTNRPLAGFANFCPGNIDTSPENFQDLLETAVHEALHALFFSELLFPYFLDEYGQERVDVIQYSPDGKKLLALPTVAKVVQEHFGCDEARGAQLENEGGDGTAGNHWESRVFQGELMDGMSGAPNDRAVFSAVTMAVIEDTGWYRANWDYQGSLGFGKGAGCDFLDSSCDAPGQGLEPWFCPTESQADSCSWDLKTVGKCSPQLLLDGCSTPVSYKNMHCTKGSLFDERITPDSYLWGFGYGANARCMREKGPLSKVPGDGYKYTKFSADSNLECYQFTCPDGKLHVVLGDHQLPCPTGEDVDLTGIGYLSGKLGPCPDNEDLCNQLSCPNLCSGNGDCSGGTCYCNIGFAGSDCSLPTCLPSSCPADYACNGATGLCEAAKKAPELPDCAGVMPSMGNASDYGAMTYLMEMQAGGVGSLNDCYTSNLPGGLPAAGGTTPPILVPGENAKPAEASAGTLSTPQDASAPSGSATVPPSTAGQNAASSPTDDAWLPVVDDQPGEVAPELNIGGGVVLSQPREGGPAASSSASPLAAAEEDGAAGVRVAVEVLQMDALKPLSTLQAEALRGVLADSAGVSIDNLTYTDLILPSSPEKAYALELEAATASPSRVMTSLYNAESYGILKSRIADEAKLQLIGATFEELTTGGSSGGAGSLVIWAAVMTTLGVAVVCCGAVSLWCFCAQPAGSDKEAPRATAASSKGNHKAGEKAGQFSDLNASKKAAASDGVSTEPMSRRQRRALKMVSAIDSGAADFTPSPVYASPSSRTVKSAVTSESAQPLRADRRAYSHYDGKVDVAQPPAERQTSRGGSKTKRGRRESMYLVENEEGPAKLAASQVEGSTGDKDAQRHAKPRAPPVRPEKLVPPGGRDGNNKPADSSRRSPKGSSADHRRCLPSADAAHSSRSRSRPTEAAHQAEAMGTAVPAHVPESSAVSSKWLDDAAQQPRRAADQQRRRHHRQSQMIHPKNKPGNMAPATQSNS